MISCGAARIMMSKSSSTAWIITSYNNKFLYIFCDRFVIKMRGSLSRGILSGISSNVGVKLPENEYLFPTLRGK